MFMWKMKLEFIIIFYKVKLILKILESLTEFDRNIITN